MIWCTLFCFEWPIENESSDWMEKVWNPFGRYLLSKLLYAVSSQRWIRTNVNLYNQNNNFIGIKKLLVVYFYLSPVDVGFSVFMFIVWRLLDVCENPQKTNLGNGSPNKNFDCAS